MVEMSPRKGSYERWSLEETNALIEAWAPLYIRHRTRSSRRSLVAEDWRAVVSAVNKYRATTGGLHSCRTRLQCKRRVEHLRRKYEKEKGMGLAPILSVLHDVWADEVGNRGAGPVEGHGAPAGYDGAAAGEGSSGDAQVIIKLAEVVTKLGGMYKDLRMKTLGVERDQKEKAAVGHAGAGSRA